MLPCLAVYLLGAVIFECLGVDIWGAQESDRGDEEECGAEDGVFRAVSFAGAGRFFGGGKTDLQIFLRDIVAHEILDGSQHS